LVAVEAADEEQILIGERRRAPSVQVVEPCTSASMPWSGFAMPSEIVADRQLERCDTSDTRKLIDVDHGPRSCSCRRSCRVACRDNCATELGAVDSRTRMAAETAGSGFADGL
jgi:hypothetical protein